MMYLPWLLSCRWGETMSPPTGLWFIHRWYMSMVNHGGMISTQYNSWFVHQSSLAVLPAEPFSSKVGGTDKGNYEFRLTKYLCLYFKGMFNMPWNLNEMGLTAVFPLRRKVYCGFLSPLKIHRPRPSFKPRTSLRMASTLIITPPRTTCAYLTLPVCSFNNTAVNKKRYAKFLLLLLAW
jgi:hypothetical protein